MITFVVPVKTVNTLNHDRGNSRLAAIIKTKRRQKERECAFLITMAEMAPYTGHQFTNPLPVTLTRLSSGKLDGDGLQAALKSIRDGIADALGVNDGSDAVRWVYAQKKCKRGEFGVEVTIT